MRNKRPLVGIALLFCAGIIAAPIFTISFAWSGIVLCAFVCGFFAFHSKRQRNLLFFPIPFLAGIFAYYYSAHITCAHDLRILIGDRPQHIAVRGIVCDWPETRSKATPRGEFDKTSLTLKLHSLRRAENWEPAQGKVLIQITEGEEDSPLSYGDEVELDGAIEPPPIARNPGQFDYRKYLARQGIYHQFRVAGTADIHVLASRRGNCIMQVAADANEYFKKCLARGIESEEQTVGLLQAIVLGFRPGLTNELSEPFMRTGTLHVFAVSGFHIALIASILVGALRLGRLSRRTSGLVSIPLLLIYTLITGAPASALRSFIMASVVIFGWALLRPHDIFNSLAAAALIVLAINPQQLFDAGFQLSFFVVLTIAVFTPHVHDRLLRWAKPDPLLPWDVVPKWRRRIFYPLSKVLLCFSVSFAAVVGSLPLIATYFHLVTPIALLSNLLIVPLSGGVIGLGFGSMVTGDLLPWATECFNNANFLLLNFTLWLNDWFASLPLGYWYLSPPPLPLTLAYYAIAGALLSGWAWQTRTRKVTTLIATVVFVVVVTGYCLWPRHITTMTVLDVGGGQAVVVDQPGSADLLIDGGRRSHGENVVRPYLRTCGIQRLAAIVLTANDINHSGGLIPIIQRFSFDQFLESTFRSRSNDYRELTDLLARSNRRERVFAGQEKQLAPQLKIKFLSPPSDKLYATAGDNSVVLQLECNGCRVLFKSEIGATVENDLIQSGYDLRSHILVTGQHVKETCCTDAFLDRVQPEIVILNAGSFPTSAYPRQEILDRLEQRNIPLYRTDDCGGVRIMFHHDHYEVQTTLPQQESRRVTTDDRR